MCHGLSGDGEVLLDLAAATGEPEYADAAWAIGDQLWDMRVRRDSRWLVPDENGIGISADYALGTSGVAAFLLRLMHGGRRPWTADAVPHGPRKAEFPAFES
jgi:lantibiotic modifying enzyme